MRSEASEELRRSREEAARMVTEAQAEADRLRSQARQVLADARAEVESMRRRRDGIATELTQLSGVIEALAVSESDSNEQRGAVMNQPDPQFRLVLRGYDPAEVDRVAISGARSSARPTRRRRRAELRGIRWQQAERPSARRAGPAQPPTFDHLGAAGRPRSSPLADEEAKELRDRAHAEVEDVRKLAEQAADRSARRGRPVRRAEAPRRRRRGRPDRSPTPSAPPTRSATPPSATPLRCRQEGEAVFEQQRANAARAAADFETTLAERRDRTTAEFQEQQAATQAQLEAMSQQVEETRAAAQREQESGRGGGPADRRSTPRSGPQPWSRDARATADRVRTESERELAAATQRRDSINAQLINVRQMLATLSGSAAGFAVDPLPDADLPEPEAEAPAPDVEEAEPEAEDAAPVVTETEGDEVP